MAKRKEKKVEAINMALQTIEETMKNEDPALFAIFEKWIT
jgi:hypothetical protein